MAPKKKPAAAFKRPAQAGSAASVPGTETGYEFPCPNVWSEVCPALDHNLRQPLRVSLPCAGIDGAGFAFDAMSIGWRACNIFDIDGRYEAHLHAHLPVGSEKPHLGKIRGDCTKLKLSNLAMADAVVSGPPCPPWAGQGCRKGDKDPRAQVFISVLEMTVFLAKRGVLKFACLENVPGILAKADGAEKSCMDSLVQVLKGECPEFRWSVILILHVQ